MSNKRIDWTQFDNITSYPDGGWEVPEKDNLSKTLVADLDGSLVCSTSVMAQIEGYSLEEAQRFARIIAQLPNIVAELKRYYGFVDELLDYFHHTILENESFMDLMYRMGVFEFEPEPWQNEKGEWMMFVGDTYETGEWVVDKDFTPNQEE